MFIVFYLSVSSTVRIMIYDKITRMSTKIAIYTDENGETCGRNSTLEVLKEVKKVYEERLKRIDEEACGNGTQEIKKMYEILNSEISEKQNQIFILQRDIQLLEEKSEQLQVTSQFKDDIIKEMRKELKLTRFKGMAYKEIIEHLKNKLIMRDNTIKQQEQSIAMLQESLMKCDNRLEDLHIKSKETELQLQDVKLRLIKHVSNTFNESIKYYKNPCKFNNWMNIIEQMKELAFTFKERGTKVKYLENMINSLSTVLDGTYTNIEEMANTTKEYQSSMPMQNDFQRLNSTMSSLLRDKDDMQRSLESANDSIRELAANMEEMIKILQDSLNLAQKEQEELKNKLNEKEAKLDEAQMKIRDLLDEIGDLRAENNQLLGNVRDQDECGEEHTDPNEDGKNDIYISRVSSEGELQLIQLMDKQKDEILYCEKKISQLKASYDAVFCKNKTLEREMELLKQELGNYNNHINDSECHTCVSQNEADNCLTTFESLQEKIYVLKGLLKEKTNNYEQLQNELSNTKLAFDELEERSNEELNCLRGEIEDHKRMKTKVKRAFSIFIKENTDLANEVEELRRLLYEYSKKAEKCTSVSQNEVNSCKGLLSSIQDKVSLLKNVIQMNVDELNSYHTGNEVLQETLAEIKEQCDSIRVAGTEKTEIWKVKAVELEGRCKSLYEEVVSLNCIIDDYKKKIDSSEQNNFAIQTKMDSISCQLNTTQHRVTVLEQLLKDKNDEYEEEKLKRDDMENKYNSLEKSMVSVQKLFEDYVHYIDSSEQRTSTAQKEIYCCKQTLNGIQRKVLMLQHLLKSTCEDFIRFQGIKNSNNEYMTCTEQF